MGPEPIRIGAVQAVTCSRCGARGHSVRECFAKEGQAYALIEEDLPGTGNVADHRVAQLQQENLRLREELGKAAQSKPEAAKKASKAGSSSSSNSSSSSDKKKKQKKKEKKALKKQMKNEAKEQKKHIKELKKKLKDEEKRNGHKG